MPKAPQPLEIARGSRNEDPARDHAKALLEATGATAMPQPDSAPEGLPSPTAAASWAASGAMSLMGEATERPRFAAAPLAIAARGAGLAIEMLSKGRVHEADWAALLGERAAMVGHVRQGRVSSGGAARLLETSDEWIAIQLPRPDDWQLVPAWLEIDLNSNDFESDPGWMRIADHLRTRTTEDVLNRGRLIGLAVAHAPRTIQADAPTYQLHNESESKSIGRRVRVLDLTSLWAGPLATSILARAGCDVLKVEAPERPDGARAGPRDFFDLMNDGKRSVVLDLHSPADRSHFERLLESADVVIESARPRALAQLGYDAESWTTSRAGRLWASITGYGRDHEWIAFGDDAAVAAGFAWEPGTPTSPVFCADAIADPVTGLHAAAAILGFRQSGRGGLLELALRDVIASTASIDAGPLVAPIESDGRGGWLLRGEGDEIVPVAAARAREIVGSAPNLTSPTAASTHDWCAPC